MYSWCTVEPNLNPYRIFQHRHAEKDSEMTIVRTSVKLLCLSVACQSFLLPFHAERGQWSRNREPLAIARARGADRGAGWVLSSYRKTAPHCRLKRTLAMATEDGLESERDGDVEQDEMEEDMNKTRSQDRPRSGRPREAKKRSKTPEEEAYLKWMNSAPTLYKRDLNAESVASIGYEGAFEPLDAPGRLNQTGNHVVVGDDGEEAILMRVVVVGGGDAEGMFLKRLSEQAAGELVSGLYVLWDPRMLSLNPHTSKEIILKPKRRPVTKKCILGASVASHASNASWESLPLGAKTKEGAYQTLAVASTYSGACGLSDHLEKIPFVNVHELGSKNTKDPKKIAQHASFLGAHMVIVVGVQPGTGPDFPTRVKAAVLEEGVTFVGPGVAKEIVEGNLETFAKLVEGTRAAVAALWEANRQAQG